MITSITFLLIVYLLLLVVLQRKELKQLQNSTKENPKNTEKPVPATNILGATKRHKLTQSDKKRQFEKPMTKTDKFAENNPNEDTQNNIPSKVYDPQEIYPMEEPTENTGTRLSVEEQEEINSQFQEKVVSDVDITLTKREIQRMHRHLQEPEKDTEQPAFATYKKIATTQFVETLVAGYTQESKRKLLEWQQKIEKEEQTMVAAKGNEKTVAPTKAISSEKTHSEFDIYKYLNP